MEQEISTVAVSTEQDAFTKLPSSSLASFDVNKFLKKTFSDFDLGRRHQQQQVDHIFEPSNSNRGRFYHNENLEQPITTTTETTDSNQRGQRLFSNRRKTPYRRAGSVPTSTRDHILIDQNRTNHISTNEEFTDGDKDGHSSNRRGRLRNRDIKSSYRSSCAYCGQEIIGRPSSSTTSTYAPRNLYCATCTSFFIKHSPSELQRRIAYDEMTRPSDILLLPPAVDVFTTNVGKKPEKAPLLNDDDSTNLNKVVLVAEDLPSTDDDDARGENENFEDFQHHDYVRHHHRGHPTKAKPPTMAPLLPYRQQQFAPQRSAGRRGDDSKINNSLYVDSSTAPVVVVYNSNNSRRSSCTSASSSNRPTCRICHLYGEPGDTLVSPCRCAGTMQYVHTSCLVHWLEISTKKVLPSPQCELCGYHYRTHHCYRFRRMHAPSCNHRDRILHFVFVIMLFIMVGCAALSAVYLRQDKGSGYKRAALNSDDIIVIASALLFFCAFFVAIFTQYRAETSVCRLCLRCWLINRHWRVKDYDRNLDYERHQHKIRHSSTFMEQI